MTPMQQAISDGMLAFRKKYDVPKDTCLFVDMVEPKGRHYMKIETNDPDVTIYISIDDSSIQ